MTEFCHAILRHEKKVTLCIIKDTVNHFLQSYSEILKINQFFRKSDALLRSKYYKPLNQKCFCT